MPGVKTTLNSSWVGNIVLRRSISKRACSEKRESYLDLAVVSSRINLLGYSYGDFVCPPNKRPLGILSYFSIDLISLLQAI
jgi:hypothetical protein